MLKVLVVGAGIAGLTTAISLRRAGHTVHIFERSCMKNEVGAAINVPPNATRFLTAWGLDPERWRFVKSRRVTIKDSRSMETTLTTSNEGTARSIGGAELYYSHRVDLHSALQWLATREDGPGKPAEIHLGSSVEAYNTKAPSITLADGTIHTGDVIIGADGVHSKASAAVLGENIEPVPTYNYAYRFLINAEDLEADPETLFWNEDREGWTRIFIHESNRRVVAYPCRENNVHNFVGIYHEEKKDDSVEDWKAGVPVTEVLERFSDFNPKLLKVISKATDVKKWPLLYRHPISRWHKGCVALAGDAAHPMLPHQGQGGAQGMEDGFVLGVVLHGASTPKDIKERLAIYEKIRRNRASVVQILSNVGADEVHRVRDELSKYMKLVEIPTNPKEILHFNFGFDVIKTTLEEMREYDPSFELPSDFFEGKVIGVPAAEQETKDYTKKPVKVSRIVPTLWTKLLRKASLVAPWWKRRAL